MDEDVVRAGVGAGGGGGFEAVEAGFCVTVGGTAEPTTEVGCAVVEVGAVSQSNSSGGAS